MEIVFYGHGDGIAQSLSLNSRGSNVMVLAVHMDLAA